MTSLAQSNDFAEFMMPRHNSSTWMMPPSAPSVPQQHKQQQQQQPAAAEPQHTEPAELDERSADALYKQAMAAFVVDGTVVTEQVPRVFPMFRKAAAQGHADATYQLGVIYNQYAALAGLASASSLDDKARAAKAFHLFKIASDLGSAAGSYNTAVFLENGKGCGDGEGGAAAAFPYYRLAASRGFLTACFMVGSAYLHGQRGMSIDVREAKRWFTMGAEKGHVLCMNSLGICYLRSKRLGGEDARAYTLFEQAASNGLAMGKYNMGFCHEHGRHVPKDVDRAFELYAEAASEGCALAEKRLAQPKAAGGGGARGEFDVGGFVVEVLFHAITLGIFAHHHH